MPWKKLANGPATESRKPVVGEPPWIHALSLGVDLPRPNILSRNAQKKTNPIAMRVRPHTTPAVTAETDDRARGVTGSVSRGRGIEAPGLDSCTACSLMASPGDVLISQKCPPPRRQNATRPPRPRRFDAKSVPDGRKGVKND